MIDRQALLFPIVQQDLQYELSGTAVCNTMIFIMRCGSLFGFVLKITIILLLLACDQLYTVRLGDKTMHIWKILDSDFDMHTLSSWLVS